MKKLLIIVGLSLTYALLGLASNSNPNDRMVNKRPKEHYEYVWRYIEHVGWRKFTPLGASIRDLDQVERVNRHRWLWWY